MRPRSPGAALWAPIVLILLMCGSASAQGLAPRAGEFVFSPGDRLVVSVWPDSTLGGIFPIEDSGVAHLPLLGALQVAGKTVNALRQELRTAYAEDLRLPVVSLDAHFRVGIIGAVRAPGLYWVDPSYGVFELISEAGGFLEDAKEGEITMTRSGGQAYRIDAERLQVPGSAEAALALRSGDRLVVPEGGGWNWSLFLQSLTLVATVAGIVTR